MKKLIFQALIACFLSIFMVFSSNSTLLAQASIVPPTGQTNTGAETATVPLIGQTNTGTDTETIVTVPPTSQTNTGDDIETIVTVPPTGQTNTGAETGTIVSAPPTNQTNTGIDTTVPPVAPPIPNPQPSSGGGRFIITYCSGVTYGEWGVPVNGYQFRDITNQSPAGCNLTVAQQESRSRQYMPVISPQILDAKVYADGSLLRGPDMKIYIIIDGKRQHIKNWGQLYRKYEGKEIKNVSFEVLAQYPEILGVKVYADGSLLRGQDKKIYFIADGSKKWVKTLPELANHKGKKINNVNNEALAQYAEVADIKVSAAANLFRDLDKKIYLISDGKKKHLKNLQDLIKYRGREIFNIDNKTLASYPDAQ